MTAVLPAAVLNIEAAASHPLMPQSCWEQVPVNKRDYRGIQHADGTWGPDTRAVDRLIGPWDPATGKRAAGYRFHALAELAHQTGTPAQEAFRPTVNDGINPGGGLIVDWLLVNAAWRHGYRPGSYQVHIPPGNRQDWPSDHRLITADLQL